MDLLHFSRSALAIGFCHIFWDRTFDHIDIGFGVNLKRDDISFNFIDRTYNAAKGDYVVSFFDLSLKFGLVLLSLLLRSDEKEIEKK